MLRVCPLPPAAARCSAHWRSRLRADELVEKFDAAALGDADVPVIRLRPPDPEALAVLAEQRADVGGEVREEIAGIGVLGDPPARQCRGEAVDDPAAVGVDEPAEEAVRVL